MDLNNRVVIVTGGASGLGAATARMAAAAGARVLIADLNAAQGEALATELGAGARFLRCDVTSEADGEAVIAAAQAMGVIAGLVNCAGVGGPAKVVGKDGPQALATFSRTIQINLIGTFNMIRLAGAAMQANAPDAEGERGVIVNTASVAAFEGQIGQAAYSASKGGVVGMTLPIAREFARDGIRVMTIAPGLFLTPMMQGLPAAAQESLGKQVPFPTRLGRPEEYAQLVGHIFANPMLNGEVIRLDGAIRMVPR